MMKNYFDFLPNYIYLFIAKDSEKNYFVKTMSDDSCPRTWKELGVRF